MSLNPIWNRLSLQMESHCEKDYGKIIPGRYYDNISKATIKNKLFLCYRGKLLEYIINNFYKVVYPRFSIRNIYVDKSTRFIATYSGIFQDNLTRFNDIPMKGTSYSSGEINNIDNRFYLCQDDLYILKDSIWEHKIFASGNYKFRKIIKYKNKLFALTDYGIGIIDNYRFKLFYISKSFVLDLEVSDNNLIACQQDGKLLIFNDQKLIKKIQLIDEINDIYIDKYQLALSCKSGLRIFDKVTLKQSSFFPIEYAIQSVRIDEKIRIVTSFKGLYIIDNNSIFKILDNVEFNRRALNFQFNMLYAGSIEGLFIISKDQFRNHILPSLNPEELKSEENGYKYYFLAFIFACVFSVIFFYNRNKKQIEVVKKIQFKSEITPDLLIDLIISNKIKSVEELAEQLKVSKVHLTRIVSKFGTTPLNILKQAKQQIVFEMLKNGNSLENISFEIGYSIQYIKKEFLKPLNLEKYQ